MARIERMFDLIGKVGMGLVSLGVIGTRFIFVVDGGERAVIFNRFSGLKLDIYGEGMHFKVPMVYIPKYFEIRTRPRSIHSVTGTRDLQQVKVSLRILFRPKED